MRTDTAVFPPPPPPSLHLSPCVWAGGLHNKHVSVSVSLWQRQMVRFGNCLLILSLCNTLDVFPWNKSYTQTPRFVYVERNQTERTFYLSRNTRHGSRYVTAFVRQLSSQLSSQFTHWTLHRLKFLIVNTNWVDQMVSLLVIKWTQIEVVFWLFIGVKKKEEEKKKKFRTENMKGQTLKQ